MAAVEWRASKDWTAVLDAYTSKFEQEDTANQFEVNLGDYNGGFNPGLRYTSATVNGNRTLTGGVATGLYPLVRGMYNKREDTINAVGLNNKFKLGGVALVADVSWSKAKREELSLENNTRLPDADTGPHLFRLQQAAAAQHHLWLGLWQGAQRQ
jgi:iron complex outermembrane recepter protein